MSKTSRKPTSTRRLRTNATVIRSSRKDSLRFWSRLKRNRRNMVLRPHMLTLNTIRFWRSSDSKIHKFKIYRGRIRRFRISVNTNRISMRLSGRIEIFIPRTLFAQRRKSMT
jgi:hypothetical protein